MTKRVRLKYVIGPSGLQLAAPTYNIVPGSHDPIIPGVVDANGVLLGAQLGDPRLANLTALADVPDEDANTAGNALDTLKIDTRYPNHWLRASGAIK